MARAILGGVASAAGLVAVGLVTTQARPSRHDFLLGGDALHLVDIDGLPSPLGFSHGALVALDPRSGAPRWSTAISPDVRALDLQSTPAVAYGHELLGKTSIHAFDPRTGQTLWDTSLPGNWPSIFRHKGCVVLGSGSDYAAFDEKTGGVCSPLAEALTTPKLGNPGGPVMEKRAALREAEQAQGPANRSRPDGKASRTMAGVDFHLDDRGDRLWVRASESGGRPGWETELPAARLSGLSFAVGDGLVLVAGARPGHSGWSKRLRVVGLDAETGKIRFVAHHPVESAGTAEIAVSGGVALVAWADELRGLDPRSGEVLWQVGTGR